MSERPNEPSGAAPRPDDAAIGPLAADEDAAVPPSSAGASGRTDGLPFRARPAEEPPRAAHRVGTPGCIALTVALLVAAVAASPWWAPRLAPLLPWSPQSGAAFSDEGQRGIEERLAALERRGETSASAAPAQPPPETVSLQRALDKVSQQLAGLEQRLADAEQGVVQLRQSAGQNAGGGTEDLAPLRADIERQGGEIAKFADRVAAIEKRLATRPAVDPATVAELQANLGKLGAALAELDGRVAKLGSAPETSGTGTDQALLLSLGQLRQAMQGSGPFAAERATALALAEERPGIRAALAPLAEAAARGIPSVAVLRQRFEGIAGAITAAGTAPAAADDWSEQILGKLRGLVTVRRVGPGAVEGSPEAAVATAESALAADDLAGAVAALETLHGAAMLAARDWLDAAHRRLAAQAALDQATGLVTARLAANQRAAQPAPAEGTKP
jgi:hypothetical protein